MDILEDLYYGNLFPHENCAELDYETKELLTLLNRNVEKLKATLSDEQKETFEKARTVIVKFLKFMNGKLLLQDLSWAQNRD